MPLLSPIYVFDPPMCCASGVCGPAVDPDLTRFAADLDWLAAQGVVVDRFNLAQQPQAFVNNNLVRAALEQDGEACLPLVLAGNHVVSHGVYPSREALAQAAGVPLSAATGVRVARRDPLPMMPADDGGCKPGSKCC